MRKTLLVAGRVHNKTEMLKLRLAANETGMRPKHGDRRGEPIIVRLDLVGDTAKRFDALRGDQGPKDFAAELFSAGLASLERANQKTKVAGFNR